MDTLKAIFLLTALCTGTGFALQCYTCTDQASNTNCMTATNCTAASTYCKTSVVSGGIGFALQCYTCTDQASNTNCMTATNCTAASTYCKTSVVSGGIEPKDPSTISNHNGHPNNIIGTN
ncbi:Hypothetical predicted protein [Pelobates cultripes]|uniref:Snake toxin/toxin-like domain-containing protein n=1 Tax=Pelobates cultripes TaxID=61616 RepID=A0AAD1W471_PELCU|nr:Hypothetical predicted protein [Pelobates cultripes]